MDKRERWAQEKAFEERILNYTQERRSETDPLGFIVSVTLTVAIVIALIFLSSAAFGATNGHSSGARHHSSSFYSLRVSDGLHGALDFRLVSAQEWGKNIPPLRFLYAWPHLPSVEETKIKIATVRLAENFKAAAEEHKKKVEALQLVLDWEAFWKAVALGLMTVGAVITLTLGWPLNLISRNRV